MLTIYSYTYLPPDLLIVCLVLACFISSICPLPSLNHLLGSLRNVHSLIVTLVYNNGMLSGKVHIDEEVHKGHQGMATRKQELISENNLVNTATYKERKK